MATKVLAVLSQETRLNLVLALAQGPASVTELCEHLGLPQSKISHHLGILRNTGLVTDSREGQFVIYRINVGAWRMLGDGFFERMLEGKDEVLLQHFQIRRLVAPPL